MSTSGSDLGEADDSASPAPDHGNDPFEVTIVHVLI